MKKQTTLFIRLDTHNHSISGAPQGQIPSSALTKPTGLVL